LNYRAVLQEMQKEQGKRVFLSCGPDDFFREEAIGRLKNSLLQPEAAAYNYTVLDGKTAGPNEVVESAVTMPFLDNFRLVVVQDAVWLSTAKKGKASSADGSRMDGLLAYVRDPMPSTCLILTAAEMDKRTALFKAISQTGMVFAEAGAGEKELFGWAKQFAESAGKKVRADALQILLDGTAKDARLLKQEMEKLFTYLGDRQVIEKDDVLAVGSRLPENNVFSLLDNVGCQRKEAALSQLQELLRGGEPPVRLLGLLVGQARLLLEGSLLQQRGYTPKQITELLGVHPYRLQKSLAKGKWYSPDELRRMLQLLLDTDTAIKRGKYEPHLALELFVLQAGNK